MGKNIVDKHIYFSLDDIKNINNYSCENNLDFTKSVRKLIRSGLKYDKDSNYYNDLKQEVKKLYFMQKEILLLLEQLYSDIGFDTLSDPRKCKTLNTYKLKNKKDMLND